MLSEAEITVGLVLVGISVVLCLLSGPIALALWLAQ